SPPFAALANRHSSPSVSRAFSANHLLPCHASHQSHRRTHSRPLYLARSLISPATLEPGSLRVLRPPFSIIRGARGSARIAQCLAAGHPELLAALLQSFRPHIVPANSLAPLPSSLP